MVSYGCEHKREHRRKAADKIRFHHLLSITSIPLFTEEIWNILVKLRSFIGSDSCNTIGFNLTWFYDEGIFIFNFATVM